MSEIPIVTATIWNAMDQQTYTHTHTHTHTYQLDRNTHIIYKVHVISTQWVLVVIIYDLYNDRGSQAQLNGEEKVIKVIGMVGNECYEGQTYRDIAI